MDKKLITIGVIGIVLIGAAFYGGIAYGQSHASGGRGNGANGQAGAFIRNGMRGAGTNSFTTGEVFSKDNNGITIKLPNGSSRIVFVGSSTQITKAAAGTLGDIAVGSNVLVQGSPNSDGSLTAQSIQLRPAGAPGIAAPRPQ
jgi:hypothetical protein